MEHIMAAFRVVHKVHGKPANIVNISLLISSCYLSLMRRLCLNLKRKSRLQQTINFVKYFLIFEGNRECYYMRIVCQQRTILVKYHALFVIIFKQWQILKSSTAANNMRRFMDYKCMHSSLVGFDA